MSVTRWIHCNSCFHLLSRKERKFYHLSCRHVLCKQCMAKTNRGTVCPICQKPLERFTELSNQMDRKEKMYYDPGCLKVLSVAYQSVVFQHRQRENMIRGILRCRIAINQMKEMEDTMRQKIVETQRRYEKFRTYRRNLQETMRQMSPRYPGGPMVGDPTTRRPALQPATPNHPSSALSNRRDDDPSSRRYDQRRTTTPTSTISSSFVESFGTPPSVTDGSFKRQHVTTMNSQRGNTGAARQVMVEGAKQGLTGIDAFANDSGISGMQTPSSSLSFGGSSRVAAQPRHQQHQYLTPSTPSTPARYQSYLHHNQMLSSINPRP
ncbi:RING finger protein nenya-like isoform X2 [Anopheles stephensi]|uniref:RING finger protein nenya-like isoform X2 n=1 Tax=Anopheles stephensi TaxID=30069 RepID=UPI0016589C69|nr:RING finger protein nenya-like isoform X2 [Anopheles stephensi]